MTAAPLPATPGRARPEVARAAEQALLPLRPMTLGEILDVGFLVVQRNARVMVGLPLVVAVLEGVAVLLLLGVQVLVSRVASDVVAWVVVAVLGALGLLAAGVLVVWLSAVMSRFSLQTVLGDGFAPAVSRITWRANLRLLGPMTGFTVLAALLLGVLSYAASLSSLLLVPFTVGGDPVAATIGGVLYLAISAWLTSWAWAYPMLAVPAYALESATAPSWIGRPLAPTWMPASFFRAISLVGWRQVPRAVAVTACVLAMATAAVLLVLVAVLLAAAVYGPVLPVQWDDLAALATRPGTWFVLGALFTVLLGAVVPFAAAVQTIFYLDLRMRRDGLDLALRFDCVRVPQPQAPPPAPPWVGP
ncbi:hypothetical protein [Auraticoccus monumenti]|uniref:Membrane domain of glycerophosphoryl diester phosphodiesterase n=1 Tax=Auraticoccus monumenti TaxID=675864 RepID=A0A1G7E3M8_9ACTN|nr:hypothetical protein [Auraticoccus monumenti]SDE58066.1 hypothetical protein SAMN04489747_3805 [Auraticoccus monumenti]